MKLITSSFVLTLSFFATSLSLAEPSPRMNAELDKYESYISMNKAHYKVEDRFQSATMKLLKDWPVEVQRSIYLKIWETPQAPFLVDPSQITSYQRSIDVEYGYSASIIRSVVIAVGKELAYLAIYHAWGGEWNRQTNFLEYYILDSKGELLRSGMSRD